MDLGTCKDENDALNALRTIRQYKPFQYGGTWHVSCTPSGVGVAYRSRADLSRRMAKEIMKTNQGCGSYRTLTISPA